MTSEISVERDADGATNRLINHIRDTSVNPDNWTAVLECFCEAFHAESSVFESYDFSTSSGRYVETFGIAPKYRRSYEDVYSALDPWLRQNEAFATPGSVINGRQLSVDAELVKSPFYSDWLRPQGLRFSLLGVVHSDGTMCWFVGLLRKAGASEFDDGDVAQMEILMPHLQQAFHFGRALSDSAAMNRAAMAALDRMPVGVAFVAADGQVIAANQLAEEIAGDADGIAIGSDGLYATNGLEQGRLRELISRASTSSRGQAAAGGPISIARDSGLRPLSLLVVPMTAGGTAFDDRRAGATVFIGDPERRAELDPSWLASTFELTAAEARIAARLATGVRLAEAARELGIGYETARTHLKRVFHKTDTDRQADLIHLIGSSTLHCRLAPSTTRPSKSLRLQGGRAGSLRLR